MRLQEYREEDRGTRTQLQNQLNALDTQIYRLTKLIDLRELLDLTDRRNWVVARLQQDRESTRLQDQLNALDIQIYRRRRLIDLRAQRNTTVMELRETSAEDLERRTTLQNELNALDTQIQQAPTLNPPEQGSQENTGNDIPSLVESIRQAQAEFDQSIRQQGETEATVEAVPVQDQLRMERYELEQSLGKKWEELQPGLVERARNRGDKGKEKIGKLRDRLGEAKKKLDQLGLNQAQDDREWLEPQLNALNEHGPYSEERLKRFEENEQTISKDVEETQPLDFDTRLNRWGEIQEARRQLQSQIDAEEQQDFVNRTSGGSEAEIEEQRRELTVSGLEKAVETLARVQSLRSSLQNHIQRTQRLLERLTTIPAGPDVNAEHVALTGQLETDLRNTRRELDRLSPGESQEQPAAVGEQQNILLLENDQLDELARFAGDLDALYQHYARNVDDLAERVWESQRAQWMERLRQYAVNSPAQDGLMQRYRRILDEFSHQRLQVQGRLARLNELRTVLQDAPEIGEVDALQQQLTRQQAMLNGPYNNPVDGGVVDLFDDLRSMDSARWGNVENALQALKNAQQTQVRSQLARLSMLANVEPLRARLREQDRISQERLMRIDALRALNGGTEHATITAYRNSLNDIRTNVAAALTQLTQNPDEPRGVIETQLNHMEQRQRRDRKHLALLEMRVLLEHLQRQQRRFNAFPNDLRTSEALWRQIESQRQELQQLVGRLTPLMGTTLTETQATERETILHGGDDRLADELKHVRDRRPLLDNLIPELTRQWNVYQQLTQEIAELDRQQNEFNALDPATLQEGGVLTSLNTQRGELESARQRVQRVQQEPQTQRSTQRSAVLNDVEPTLTNHRRLIANRQTRLDELRRHMRYRELVVRDEQEVARLQARFDQMAPVMRLLPNQPADFAALGRLLTRQANDLAALRIQLEEPLDNDFLEGVRGVGEGLQDERNPTGLFAEPSAEQRLTALETHAAQQGVALIQPQVDQALAQLTEQLNRLQILTRLIGDQEALRQQLAAQIANDQATLQQHQTNLQNLTGTLQERLQTLGNVAQDLTNVAARRHGQETQRMVDLNAQKVTYNPPQDVEDPLEKDGETRTSREWLEQEWDFYYGDSSTKATESKAETTKFEDKVDVDKIEEEKLPTVPSTTDNKDADKELTGDTTLKPTTVNTTEPKAKSSTLKNILDRLTKNKKPGGKDETEEQEGTKKKKKKFSPSSWILKKGPKKDDGPDKGGLGGDITVSMVSQIIFGGTMVDKLNAAQNVMNDVLDLMTTAKTEGQTPSEKYLTPSSPEAETPAHQRRHPDAVLDTCVTQHVVNGSLKDYDDKYIYVAVSPHDPLLSRLSLPPSSAEERPVVAIERAARSNLTDEGLKKMMGRKEDAKFLVKGLAKEEKRRNSVSGVAKEKDKDDDKNKKKRRNSI